MSAAPGAVQPELLSGLRTFGDAEGGGVHWGEACADEQGDARGEPPATRPRLSALTGPVSGADDWDSLAQL